MDIKPGIHLNVLREWTCEMNEAGTDVSFKG